MPARVVEGAGAGRILDPGAADAASAILAKRSGRQAFTETISLLAKSSCKVILVEKTDRLYRNIKDWVTVADLDVEVHLVKEGTVLSENSLVREVHVRHPRADGRHAMP